MSIKFYAPSRRPKPQPKPHGRRIPKLPLDILVCTPDVTSDLAQRCIASLKETTGHIQYNLLISDNNHTVPFSHHAEINRKLNAASGYLVICDDDVTFTPGWLDSALDIVENRDDCGIVAFHLYDAPGKLWASAMWNSPDGNFVRHQTIYNAPCCIPSQCSACWLVAPTDLRMDERYQKCRFEHVFCYEMWAGGE